jgi:hypothetical protein
MYMLSGLELPLLLLVTFSSGDLPFLVYELVLGRYLLGSP